MCLVLTARTACSRGSARGELQRPGDPAGLCAIQHREHRWRPVRHLRETEREKHDDVAGLGHGFVDVFDTSGHLIRRFASRGRLNSPWGIARASFAFGPYSGKILVGNFGDGRINVFNNDGDLVDQLEDSHGKPLVIDGLWTLTLGGGLNSSPDTLYFSAGPDGETNGLFGTITPALDALESHRSAPRGPDSGTSQLPRAPTHGHTVGRTAT